ncbi:Rrf2 family transcriptional regulator [Mucilaginibacter sp. CSA2-8R]|uniref:Rrf2 family transcriptional regulator n=1 Tax=Mucilaginibacter sp. CSA2-8R TaxID=3141542 RepID=UPI00315DD7A1
MTGRFQIAVHILTLLHSAGAESLSSDYMAGSININPVLVRKELSGLRKAGLVQSKEGNTGGYTLAKPAQQISIADIYNAVAQAPLLGKARNLPNPACPIGLQINQHMDTLNEQINEVVVEHLGHQTLEQFYNQFN